jgi:RNA polymerase sigma factor (sigma-70 family)
MSEERPTPTPEAPKALDIETVCARNTRNIVKWLLTFGVPRAEVGDASQEVFQTILQLSGRFDPANGDAVGWVYRITMNVGRNYMRREWSHLRALLADTEVIPEHYETPENILKQKRDSEFLWSVIEKMEEGPREAVIAYLNGLTLEATATALGIPRSTAHFRLKTAKTTLQEAFHARERGRSRRGGVLPLLLPIDALLRAERARLDAVPPDAVASAQAALDQTLAELGRGPTSGVREVPTGEKSGSPEQERIARLLKRIRPFLTSSVLGALALMAPWLDPTPRAPVLSTPVITREVVAASVESPSSRPAEDSLPAPPASSPPAQRQPMAGAYVVKQSPAPSSASSLPREKLEAAIRAMRRGDASAFSAIEERSGDSLAALRPARTLLQQRTEQE